jgi:hypothetical protein
MNDAHNPYTPPKAEVSAAGPELNVDVSKTRPVAVNIALFLLGVEILLSAVGVADAPPTMNRGAKIAAVLIGGIDIAVTALLCVFVADGRNWARIVFLVLWIFSLAGLLMGLYMAFVGALPAGTAFDTSWTNVLWLATPHLLSLTIVVLLFGPGRSWFRKRERTERGSKLRMFALIFTVGLIVLAIVALAASYRPGR